MTNAEIEHRIAVLQQMMATETNASTLATINRCIEKLVMMEPDDEEDQQ